ncbi:MAG: biotin/lipoyl-containing protein [Chloroflexota bacterium]
MTEQPQPGEPREERFDEPAHPEGRGLVDPVPVGPGDPSGAAHRAHPGPPSGAGTAAHGDAGEASLLALVDRLAAILEKSDLGELEMTAGGTSIIVRSPAAIERPVTLATAVADGSAPEAAAPPAGAPGAAPPVSAPPPAKPSVKAPLTGIYYGAPSPGAMAYVKVGDHVSAGQIIGLIEAMKLFNEIKSDLSGRVARICVENGALVKAKSPLIEVEPA